MPQTTSKRVVKLYDVMSTSFSYGVEDYTDGMYYGNPNIPYEVAQKNQHNYLLDEIHIKRNSRLLDVGCGLGALLKTAIARGVRGVGITISKPQVVYCRGRGINAHLFNYRELPDKWNGTFDGIVANGSLEHFCQPEDASLGMQDHIYREMFEIFARLLDDKSNSQRVVTAAIHFRDRHISPKKIIQNPFLSFFDDEAFHFSMLLRSYGGYYPIKGQLEKCAKGIFKLVKEEDGTEDYRLTSEYWCKRFKHVLLTNSTLVATLLKHFLKKPIHTFQFMLSQIGLEAWPWQFRGQNPPTRLYRQTWEKV